MRRRFLLLGATALAAPSVHAGGAWAAGRQQAPGRGRGPAPRRLQIRHAHNGARFSGPYHDGRAADPVAMAELSLVLADTRTGAVRPFDPRAIDVLWTVGQKAGAAGEFLIFSGYRTPETNALVDGAGDSQHLRAAALDIHVASERLAGFAETALRLGLGGVGMYPERGFVHLDSGPVRHWGDAPSGLVVPASGGRAPAARPAAPDPLARIADAWAAARGR